MKVDRELLFEGLDSSLSNGYFNEGELLHNATAEDIATDVVAFAADFENHEASDLVPFIKEWMKINGIS